MNFVMNHAPGAGLLARPVYQQSSALPLSYGCPLVKNRTQHPRSKVHWKSVLQIKNKAIPWGMENQERKIKPENITLKVYKDVIILPIKIILPMVCNFVGTLAILRMKPCQCVYANKGLSIA